MAAVLCVRVVPLTEVSTGFVFRQLRPEEHGFDYAAALREVHRHLTYDQIAEFCGYENKASVFKVLQGAIPDHPHGEAIYILFTEMFRRKPPAKVALGKPELRA